MSTDDEAAGNTDDAIPPEVLDLVRFLAATWVEIDKWAYRHCSGEALMKYPVIQGTMNQIRLHRIGEQPLNKANVGKAVAWMQRYNSNRDDAAIRNAEANTHTRVERSKPSAVGMLPKDPPPGLLMSMAIRYDHALGCSGHYDSVGEGEHEKRLQSVLTTMRQLYEEVSGHGFYRADLEAEYAEKLRAVTGTGLPLAPGHT